MMDLAPTSDNLALVAARRTLELERDGLAALLAALDEELGPSVSQAVATIRAATGRVIVTGMGKSGHVGRKIAATMTSTGTPAHFVHPAEASHGDLGMIQEQDVVIALSWSGEAPELSDIVAYTRRFKVPLLAITSRLDSALGRAADVPLILPIMPEACPNGLAPTTSTTMQMAMGDVLAVALLSLRGFSAQDFRQFHPGGKLGSQLRSARDLMHSGLAVPMVPESATLSEAIMEMTGKRFGITAVVDGNGLLSGVVTDGDLRRAFDSKGFADHPVSAIMTRSPRTIGPNVLASQVLAEMNRAAITTFFVVEDRRPIGVVNIHDLLRAGVA
jgi:arabinose-5-phosphate isomerase